MSVAREAAASEKSATRGGCVNRYEWWQMRGAATGRRVADAGRDKGLIRPTRLVWRREADVPKRGMGVADGVNVTIGKSVADAGRDREGRTANEIGVAEEISASNATKGDLLQFFPCVKSSKKWTAV